jgi:hypothetical protein
METKIRKMIIKNLDLLFENIIDNNFKDLNDDITEEEADEIESIFMSYRNVIAGTEWDGNKREYEKYEVK